MVDLVVLRRRKEELQGPRNLQREIVKKRPLQVGLEVLRQVACPFGSFRLFLAHAILAHDVLGQLASAESLFTRIHRLIVAQYGDVHDVRPDVDQGNGLVLAASRKLALDQFECCLGGIRFDIHDQRLQACRFGHSNTILDFFLAGGRNQHLRSPQGLLGAGPTTWKSRLTSSSAKGMY
jgi:hypothetical protein